MSRSPRTHTLADRLAFGAVAWIGLWALALLLIFNLLLSGVLTGQVDAALRARAEAVAATITVLDGRLEITEGDDAALDAGTSIYFGPTLIEGADLDAGLRGRLIQHGDRTTDGEIFGPVRYLATPIVRSGRQIGTIVVSSHTGARSRAERTVALASIAFAGLMLLFTFFALRATIGRAMRPVRAMGDAASAWSDQEIDRRFDPETGPLELRRLAVTLNALLERISATVRYERRFTAELSHELRTPLAHLHAEVDLLAAAAHDPVTPEPAPAQSLDELLTSIRRLEGLLESALAPALVRPHGSPGLTRAGDVLTDLPRPASSRIELIVTGRLELILAVEHEVARRALLPVLENAWRYAAHEVRIEVGVHAGQAEITVSDDGGQLDPEQTEIAFDPGFRADPADRHPGAGLGLALTRRICRSTGGDAIAAVDGGRTVITLRLPYLRP